jgi:ABC-type branched-subunit amino acid transport system ATPase component/ABC-type branched-subunit amino acid transport system permease subunit
VASTVGLILVVLAIGNIWYGSVTSSFPSFLPTSTVRFGGINVGYDQMIEVAITLVGTVALYLFFRYVRMGIAMRGVVDDPDLVAMTGESPVVVRRWAWVIGATFAALSGLLIAPSLSLDALILTELVVQAFGAAAIGYFSSLPLTYVGGLVVGVAGSLATKYVTDVPALSGLPPGLPFIILFVVLIVTPRARLTERRYSPTIALKEAWHAPPRVRVGFATAFTILACLVPLLVGAKLSVYTAALIAVILFLSLGLLVRTSGQVSLCQYAFAAVGASAFAHFSHSLGIPWLVALLLAGLVAVPIGAVVAIPAIRLSGVFLALATFGFGILMEQMFYTMSFMFGASTSGVPAPRPAFSIGPWHMATDRGFYYLVLLITVLMSIGVTVLLRGRLGRLLRGMSDSAVALETHGTTVNVTRVLVFCISAFMASIAGALTASLFSFAVGSEFASFSSLTLIALLVLMQAGAPWYAVMAGIALEIVPEYITIHNITNYLDLIFGISAALSPYTSPRLKGMPTVIRRFAERLGGQPSELASAMPATPGLNGHHLHALGLNGNTPPAQAPIPSAQDPGPTRGASPTLAEGHTGLELSELTVRYGGAVAVSELTLVARCGLITGLIGPNGAGKTTTFNAATGLVRPNSGAVTLHGRDVTGMLPSVRARRGLGRTFQRVELFSSLSVRDNIALGREASMAGGNPAHQIVSGRGQNALIERSVDEAIRLTGLSTLADLPVADASTGQKRLVELARVLAGPFDMILLDEPSSGLDKSETEQFGQILRQVVAERGIGVLIVEHDMALVRQVCDQVFVLDFGQLVFQGSPAAMLDSPIVKAAYLGSESGLVEASPDGVTVDNGVVAPLGERSL